MRRPTLFQSTTPLVRRNFSLDFLIRIKIKYPYRVRKAQT